jgi:hypothetical protein
MSEGAPLLKDEFTPALHVPSSPSEPEVAGAGWAWAACFACGLGTMLPFNALISPVDYWVGQYARLAIRNNPSRLPA